jgi:hypothetical protein
VVGHEICLVSRVANPVRHSILDKLRKHDLYLKPEKCVFEKEQVEFLGVILKGGTIQMDPSKIKGVADWPRPNNVRDV